MPIALKTDRREPAELNRSQQELLAALAHELQAPLAAILGFNDLTCEQAFGPIGDAQYLECAHMVQESARHLQHVVETLLGHSTTSLYDVTPQDQVVDVGATIDRCIRMYSQQAQQAGLSFYWQPCDDLPALLADEHQVAQMLINLVGNAVKFTTDRGWIHIDADVDGSGCLCLTVSDSGAGIAAEDLQSVQGPFVSIGQQAVSGRNGLGLGLAITKHFIEKHGGVLTIESTVGIGTRAKLRFPASRTLYADHETDTVANFDRCEAA